MSYYTNTDPQQDALNTLYPFALYSTMQLGLAKLPQGLISAMVVHVPSWARMPLHIGKIYCSGNQLCVAVLMDADSRQVSTVSLAHYTRRTMLQSVNGCPAGILHTDGRLYSILYSAVKYGSGGTLQLPRTALQILPQCCVPVVLQGAQAVIVGGYTVTQSCKLRFSTNIKATVSAGVVGLSMYGDYVGSAGTAIRTVQSVSVVNKHLLIQPRMLSDARVVTDVSIKLVGVKDVD